MLVTLNQIDIWYYEKINIFPEVEFALSLKFTDKIRRGFSIILFIVVWGGYREWHFLIVGKSPQIFIALIGELL